MTAWTADTILTATLAERVVWFRALDDRRRTGWTAQARRRCAALTGPGVPEPTEGDVESMAASLCAAAWAKPARSPTATPTVAAIQPTPPERTSAYPAAELPIPETLSDPIRRALVRLRAGVLSEREQEVADAAEERAAGDLQDVVRVARALDRALRHAVSPDDWPAPGASIVRQLGGAPTDRIQASIGRQTIIVSSAVARCATEWLTSHAGPYPTWPAFARWLKHGVEPEPRYDHAERAAGAALEK